MYFTDAIVDEEKIIKTKLYEYKRAGTVLDAKICTADTNVRFYES